MDASAASAAIMHWAAAHTNDSEATRAFDAAGEAALLCDRNCSAACMVCALLSKPTSVNGATGDEKTNLGKGQLVIPGIQRMVQV